MSEGTVEQPDVAADPQIGGGGPYEMGRTGADGQVLTVKIYGVDVPIDELTAMADPKCGNCWTAHGTPQQGSYVVTRVENGKPKRYRQLCECCVRRYARAHKPAIEEPIEALPEEEGWVKAVQPGALERRAERLRAEVERAVAEHEEHERRRATDAAPYAASLGQAHDVVAQTERKLANAKAQVLGCHMVVANHQERMAILQSAVDQVEGDIADAQEAVAAAEELVAAKEHTLRQMEGARDGARKLWERELAKGEPHARKLANRVEQLRHRLALVEARLPKAPEAG